MIVKLKDVAKAAQVSEATASLALNGSSLVREETRNRVRKAAEELGYAPNAIAQGLARKRSKTIGLIVPDIESAYYGKVVRCVNDEVRNAGYGLILAISNDSPEAEKQIVDSFISQRVEGIIIVPMHRYNEALSYFKKIRKSGISCVFMTAHYPQVEAACVMADLEDGTYKLVKYLLDLGHRKIIFMGGPKKIVATSYRLEGYKGAFNERGLKVDESLLLEYERLDYEQGYDGTLNLIKAGVRADAIITINDSIALGVINAFRSNDIDVPGSISVAGYDNMIFSRISPVPITTVSQNIEQMSWKAVSLLLDQINNKIVSTEMLLIKTELVIRESTAARL
jgi:LacI family transcriptional regulator